MNVDEEENCDKVDSSADDGVDERDDNDDGENG